MSSAYGPRYFRRLWMLQRVPPPLVTQTAAIGNTA